MGYGKFLNQYKRSNIETAGKLDLVIMCYEKAILCLEQTKEHIIKKEFEKKAEKFQKALDIISELQCSLNMEKGGQIAKNLDALYSYITKRLILGDVQKDLAVFDESIHILSELLESWKAIKSTETDHEETVPKRDGYNSETSRFAAY
jgi:flagellar secretion chaperone FliS